MQCGSHVLKGLSNTCWGAPARWWLSVGAAGLVLVLGWSPAVTAEVGASGNAGGASSELSAATEGLPHIGGTAAVSPEVLDDFDAGASQRLRFEVGDRVFFAPGSAALGLRARLQLARQAVWLNAWQARSVIVGHADEGGSTENDERIALRRAEAVRDRLVEEGVPVERLQILALGRRERIAPCEAQACAAQNRRAVTFVLSAGTTPGF